MIICIFLILIFGISSTFASADIDNIQNGDNLTYEFDEILTTSDSVEDSFILSTDDNDNLSQDSNSEVLKDPMYMIYISPDGTQDGSSESSPSNWDDALDNINEGGSIILLPGTYSNILSQGINKPITIKGIDDGVILDAQTNGNFFTISSDNVIVEKITFKNGYSYTEGGAIKSTKATKIINCTFINNNARDGGGAIYLSGENSIIANCSFYRNYVSLNTERQGGAVRVSGKVNITNCIFDSNYVYSATGGGVDGGALAIMGNDVIVDNCLFNNNSAYGCEKNDGGAITVQGSNTIIKNSNFTNNRGSWDGAVSLRSSSNSVINCNFINNTANEGNKGDYGGGAIFVYSASNSVINCTFINNTARKNSGGAILTYGDAKYFKLFNCSFINNNAAGSGGAIYFSTLEEVKYNNLTLINNYAGAEGGAIYFPSNLLDYIFTNDETKANVPYVFYFKAVNNTAKTNGGTFCIKGSLFGMTFNDCNFDNSHSTSGNGGTIYISGELTDFKYDNISFVNTYANNGGAIYVEGAVKNLELNDKIIFKNNSATTNGGTFYVGGAVTNLKIHDVSFDTHAETGSGGAIYIGKNVDTLDISNVEFSDVTAGANGGVLYIGGSLTKFTYNNVAFINTSANNGGAIYVGGAVTDLEFNDNIIFKNNTATTNGGTLYFGSTVTNLKIHDVSFDTHAETGSGGAIYIGGVVNGIDISNVEFSDVTAGANGGALFFGSNVNGIDISNVEFSDVTAGANGGALFFGGSLTKFTYDNVAFINTSANNGGAIYFNSVKDINLTGIKFINNTATTNGGTLYFASTVTDVKISDIDFDTHAGANGGAIYIGGTITNLNLDNINVENTYAKTGSGGALYIDGAVNGINISNIDFINITAGANGGAIFFGKTLTGLTYNDLSFINTSANNGGAIFFNGAVSDLNLEDIVFYNNTATTHGGALYFAGAVTDLTIKNIDFNSHAGTSGGVICFNNVVTRFNLDHVNVTNVYAEKGSGGAVYFGGAPVNGVNISNVHFENISAGARGGVIHFNSNGHYSNGNWNNNDLVLTNVTVRNVSANQYGGFISVQGHLNNPIFNNVTVVISSTKIYDGGAIHIENSCKNPVFNNVSFINTSATGNGGAVCFGGTLTNLNYNNLSFINTSAKGGGAIYFGSAVNDLTFDGNVRFINTTATGSGGALFFSGAVTDLTIKNIDFNSSHAGSSGGVICFNNVVTRFNLDHVNVTNVYAKTGYGGAVYFGGAPVNGVNISNVHFENISAGARGGVIHFNSNGHYSNGNWNNNDLVLTNVTVRNVSAKEYGGFISVHGHLSNPIFNNVSVVNSSSKIDGGALYITNSCKNPVFNNVSFINTSAARHGGAIYFGGDPSTLTNLTYNNLSFINTSAKGGNGGAIYFAYAINDLTFDGNIIFFNTTAAGSGGALYFASSVTDLIINNINFTKSNAAGYGGVIYIAGATTRINITNTNFTDTKANYGGALSFGYNINKFNLINVTVLHSNATTSGGFMYLTSSANGGSGYHNDIVICNVSVADVHAQGGAGGFICSARSINRLVIENANFTNVNATGDGGVMSFASYGTSYSVNGFNITNVNFTGTSAKGKGGAIHMNSASTDLLLKNTAFTDVDSSDDGGVIYIGGASSNFNAENVNVTNASSGGKGGAIYMGSSTGFLLNDANFIGVNATNGGIIFINGASSNFNAENVNVTNVYAKSGNGGAIYIGTSVTNFKMNNSNLNNINAFSNGGVIYAAGTVNNMNLINIDFTPAHAGGNGGTIYLGGATDKLIFKNLNFTGSYATGDGGAVYFGNSLKNFEYSNLTFISAYANGSGGAVYFTGDVSDFDCSDILFIDNHAGVDGGSLYFKGTVNGLFVHDIEFINTTAKNGGSIYINGAATRFNVTNVNFTNVNASGDGGVIYAKSIKDSNYYHLNLTNHFAGSNGGVIYIKETMTNFNMTDIYLANNNATTGSGGIMYIGGKVTNILMSDLTIINASSGTSGGVMYVNNALEKVTFDNVVIVNSSAKAAAGAIYATSVTDVNLFNVSVVNSSAKNGIGGAVYFNGAATRLNIIDVNFTNVNATDNGGSIYIGTTVTNMNFTNVNIINSSSVSKNGGSIFIGSTVTNMNFTNVNITNSKSGSNAGVLYIGGKVTNLLMSDLTIINAFSGASGGVMYVNNALEKVTFDNVVIVNSSAKTLAGAIYATSVTDVDLFNVSVVNSSAKNGIGGAVYFNGAAVRLKVIDVNFTNINATSNGGVIYLGSMDTCELANMNFNNTRSTGGSGGAIFVNGIAKNSYMDNINFIEIHAKAYGGVIYIANQIDKVNFTNINVNTSSADTNNGGVFYFDCNGNRNSINDILMTNLTFNNTFAGDSGGIMYVNGQINRLTAKNIEIQDTVANKNGGVLHTPNSVTDVTIDNVIINNTVAKTGDSGAFHLGNLVTRLNINNVNITNSRSSGAGGLMYVYSTVNGMTLTNCNIINSTSTSSSGGLIYFRCYNSGVNDLLMANLTVNNSLAKNGAGGLIYVYGALSNFDFINNTIATSLANNGQGGTIYVGGALTNANLINTNITDSSSKTQGGVLYVGGRTTSIVIDNCNFTNTSASGAGGVISLNGGTDNVRIYNTQFENYKQFASSKITNGGVIYLTASQDVDIQNVSFKNNINLETDGYGGILYIPSANNVNLNNVNFTHTYIKSGSKLGGAMYLGSAARDVRLTNVIFVNNTLAGTNSRGAALYIGEVKNYNVYLTNVSFDNAKLTGNSGWGGSAYIGQTNDLYLTNVNFTNSYSTLDGGALYLTGTSNSLNLDNVKFINASASNYGGAIYNGYNGVVKINNSLFENITSGTAAVYFYNKINGIIFNNTDFIKNTNTIPNSNGASIYFATANSQNVQILKCNFKEASVSGNGGAVYFNTVSDSKIVNSTFSDSKAKLGGAIYISGGSLISVTDSKFIDNTAEAGGGAIYWTGTRGSVLNSEFINNTAVGDYNGGAIYIDASATNLNILKSNFTGNNASNGGALYVLASDTTINYCNFTKNNARYDGGAIYIVDTTQRVNVLNSLFKNNTAEADGGAIYISGQSNKITNSTFIENRANNGGGVYDYITNDRVNAINTIWNSTFSKNIAIANGGGTFLKKSENYVDWDDFSGKANRDPDTSRLTWSFSGYSDVYYIYKSLYDEKNRDYQLVVRAIADSTSTVNIRITLPPHVSKDDENDKKTSLIVYVTGDNGIEPRVYDVCPIDTNPVILQDSFPIGNYTVKVVFSDDTYLEKENYTKFTIRQNKGDFEYLQELINNYTSEGIQELVLNRSFIFTVIDGEDIDFSQVNITADYPFTIRGEDPITGGPITIDALGKCRIFLVNSSNITLENINFINGNVNGDHGDGNLNGGAIHWNANNGTLINCTFKNNIAEYGGGLYLNSTSSNCKIINCEFIDNNATYNGGAIDCNASRMNLTNTLFESNRAQYGAALCREINATNGLGYNNTFTSNHAYKSGAALAWMNATSIKIDTYYFYDNTADEDGGAIYVGAGSENCQILNSYFKGNNVTNSSNYRGGAIYWFAKEGTIFNSIFEDNNAFEGGAIYVSNSSGDININKSTFKRNNAVGDGGAIFLGASTSTINQSNFYDNTAVNGGALYVGGNSTTNYIYSSTFEGNNATDGLGGAVDWVASTGHIIDSTFKNNYANYGGAVYMGGESKNSEISHVIFDGNIAKYNGGAIDWNAAYGNLTHTIFRNNVANYGAALCREAGATSGFGFNNTFERNHARISGAGLAWMGSAGIKIDTYYFNYNTAEESGAAIYVSPESHNCIIINSNFTGNEVLDEISGIGGAIDCEAENATIINSNFTQNSAVNGGAIFVGSASGTTNITDSTFTRNSAVQNGGAINLDSSSVRVNNSEFYYNTATNGAGMYVGGSGLTNYVYLSTFEGNTANNGRGGAIDWVASAGHIINSTFTKNSADYGGGVYMGGESKNSVISRVTFDGNTAVYNGGAIDWNSTGGNLTHTLFKNNEANYGAALCREAGATAGYGYNNTFNFNHARIAGAALGWMESVGISIDTYFFNDNTADVCGGAIYISPESHNCTIENSEFNRNKVTNQTSGQGGAIYCGADNATVRNSNFTSNEAVNGGAIYVGGNGFTNNIYSSNFDNNKANGGHGGAIDWVASTGNIVDSNFTRNTADYGGAVYIGGNSINSRITHVVFESNTAVHNGGAIDWNATGGNLTNTRFIKNVADYGAALCREANSTGGFGYNNTFIANNARISGAALGWLGAKGIKIDNYTFINNTAEVSGGSIYVGPGSDDCKVYNSQFENSASNNGRGGDIDWVASNGEVINSTFKNSKALYGGSIYIGENSNSTAIINSSFNQTRSLGSGGALDWHGDDGTIMNCNFTSSFAFEKGGVISGSDVANMTISNSRFAYNMASGYQDSQGNAQGDGAVIYWENGYNLNITDSIFNDNEGHNMGGTIAIVNTSYSNMYNVSIKGSLCVRDGGAISWINSTNITLDKLSIHSSAASYNGGSIYFSNIDNATIKNSKFNNTSTPWGNGGALYINGNVTIDNVTFTDYKASSDNAAAIYFEAGNSTVVNSTFTGPNSIWVGNNATVYLTKNNNTGSNPNKDLKYLTEDYDSKYNAVDYSIWNDGTLYLEGNNFDYVIFNNGTIKTHVDIYMLDNKTWNVTLNENFTFFANIKDDNKNTIISIQTLDSYNDHKEYENDTYFMPYNRFIHPATYQGVFIIFGKDKGLVNFTLHTGIVNVKTSSKIELNHTNINDEVIVITAKVTPKGNYTFDGKVTFKMGDRIETVNVTADGIATWRLNNLSSGTYTVTAFYSGDSTHLSAENSTLLIVEKRQTWIKIVINNIVWGSYAQATVTTNGNGTVLLSMNGRTEEYQLSKNGTRKNNTYVLLVPLDTLYDPGNYTMSVVYVGDEYYEYALNETNFTVFKQNTTINAIPTNVSFWDNETINVTVNMNATGYVKVTILVRGVPQDYVAFIDKGTATFKIPNLFGGDYINVPVVYDGDIHFNGNVTYINFTVKPTTVFDMDVEADNIEYGQNATVRVYLPTLATGNATIFVDGINRGTVNVNNGVVVLNNISGLDGGKHYVNVTYNGCANYAAKNFTDVEFNVTSTNDWDIKIDIEENEYGKDTIINITAPEDATNKNVTVNIDGKNYTVNLTDGKGSLALNNLSAGMHKINVTYTDDGRYTNKAAATKFFIEQVTPTIIISVDPIKVGQNATISINIPENVTGNVTIYVGDQEFNRTVVKHNAELNVSNLAYGKYNVVVYYNGDVNFTKSTNSTNLTVDKWASEVNITIGNLTHMVGDTFTIKVTNNTFANVTINGKHYDILSGGYINITTSDLNAGKYRVTAVTPENDKYFSNSTTVIFNVIKYNSTVSVVVLPDEVHYVGSVFVINVTNNTVAKVTINGKEYGILSNGNVNVTTADLAAGEYTVVVTTPENKKYNSNVSNVTIVINKRPSSVNVTVNATHMFGDVFDIIVDNNTVVNVTINGKSYSVLSNKKVSITSSTLPAGHYVVVATIYENGKYLGNSATKEFDIIKYNSSVKVVVLPNEVHYVGDVFVINVTNNTVAKVTINGKEYNILANGNVNVTTGDLAAGEYTVIVTIPENEKYNADQSNVTFIINKRVSSVNVTVNATHMFGDEFDIIVDNSTVVNVTINGKSYSVLSNKKVNITTSNLPTGHYVVIATIYENGKYLGNSATKEFDIIKLNSTVNVTVSSGGIHYVGDSFIINVTNNTVAKVTINGKEYNILANGTVNVTTADLTAGDYTVIASTPENDKYYANSSTLIFTISKRTSSVNVTVGDQFVYGTVFNVTVKNTTFVNVTLNGKRVDVKADGTLDIDSTTLAAGHYVVIATIYENAKYIGSSDTKEFNITKLNSTVSISINPNTTHIVGDTFTIKVENNTVAKVTINGDEYAILSDGTVNVTTSKLAAGEYTVIATTPENAKYNANSSTVKFSIKKLASSVNVTVDSNTTHYVGDSFTIKVENSTAASVTVNGVDYKLNSNGTVNIDTSKLAAGDYTVTAVIVENEKYMANSSSVSFTITRLNSTVKVHADNINYGQDAIVVVDVPKAQTGYVTVTVNGKNHTALIKNGQAIINITGLNVKIYSIKAVYLGDDNYFANTNQSMFEVFKADLNATVIGQNVTNKENSAFIIIIPDNFNGIVNITVDNITYSGEAKSLIKMDKLTSGNKTAKVVFYDDPNYNDLELNVTFKVSNVTEAANITTIKSENMTRGYNSQFDYQAAFLDSDGNALADTKVQYVVNNKTYTVKTNKDGIAQLTNAKLGVGTYNITSINLATGESTVNEVTIVKRIIKNKDMTIDFLSGKYYVVQVIGDDGKPVGEGEIIDIYANTIHYVAKTDKNGYARLKINLNPKKYSLYAEYRSFKTNNNKIVVKQTLKLVKKTVKVKKGKKLVLKAKLKWSNGKAIKGKKIVFKFKGKKYTAKTNKKGIAKVVIKKKVTKKLKKGKKYKYTATYKTNTVKGKVKVKK